MKLMFHKYLPTFKMNLIIYIFKLLPKSFQERSPKIVMVTFCGGEKEGEFSPNSFRLIEQHPFSPSSPLGWFFFLI